MSKENAVKSANEQVTEELSEQELESTAGGITLAGLQDLGSRLPKGDGRGFISDDIR